MSQSASLVGWSAFHLLCNCPSLISLRMRLFSEPILSVEEYEGASASALLWFALASGRFTLTPWFVHSYTEKIICGIVGFFLTCIRFFLYSYHCTFNVLLLVILCCRVGVFLSSDRFFLYAYIWTCNVLLLVILCCRVGFFLW
jgi:hypothetical protein